METLRPENFDFDVWSRLAASDPDAFELRRRASIEQIIQRAPQENHARLRGLQFRLDMERRRSRTPLAACLRMSDMMWQALLGPGGLQDALNQLISTAAENPRKSPAVAQTALASVIHFPDRKHTNS